MCLGVVYPLFLRFGEKNSISKAFAGIFFGPRDNTISLKTLVTLYGFCMGFCLTRCSDNHSTRKSMSVGCHQSWLDGMVSILVSSQCQIRRCLDFFFLRRCSFREFHLGVMSGILCRFSLANVVPQELP